MFFSNEMERCCFLVPTWPAPRNSSRIRLLSDLNGKKKFQLISLRIPTNSDKFGSEAPV